MNFRTVLKHLERLEEANFEEFAEATNIPRHNASVYLSRLFKMGLANRRIDRIYRDRGYLRKPYRYQVSKNGKKYLKWLKEELPKRKRKELIREVDRLLQKDKELPTR